MQGGRAPASRFVLTLGLTVYLGRLGTCSQKKAQGLDSHAISDSSLSNAHFPLSTKLHQPVRPPPAGFLNPARSFNTSNRYTLVPHRATEAWAVLGKRSDGQPSRSAGDRRQGACAEAIGQRACLVREGLSVAADRAAEGMPIYCGARRRRGMAWHSAPGRGGSRAVRGRSTAAGPLTHQGVVPRIQPLQPRQGNPRGGQAAVEEVILHRHDTNVWRERQVGGQRAGELVVSEPQRHQAGGQLERCRQRAMEGVVAQRESLYGIRQGPVF